MPIRAPWRTQKHAKTASPLKFRDGKNVLFDRFETLEMAFCAPWRKQTRAKTPSRLRFRDGKMALFDRLETLRYRDG